MFNLPSPVQRVALGELERFGLELWVKRDDLIHPEISGNKWRKLKYYFEVAKMEQHELLVSFGGAFSNHLAALAAAGQAFDIPTLGIVRGEDDPTNPTLNQLRKNDMELRFVTRTAYRNKAKLEAELQFEFPNALVVPEGGAGAFGVKGCTEILAEVKEEFDVVCVACGTGTTLAGLAISAKAEQQVLGFPAMKQGIQLIDRTDVLLDEAIASGMARTHTHPYTLATEYHFDGFAKINNEQVAFMRTFTEKNGFQLDPVYTGKLFFGLFDMIGNGFFAPGTKVLAIHSGGLQGLGGMKHKGVSIYGDGAT